MNEIRFSIAAAFVALAGFAGSAAATHDAAIKSSRVKITTSGFDFGGRSYVAGAPTGSGDLSWRYDDGNVTPQLSGYLHLSGVEDRCARMRLDYYGGAHTRLTTRYGGRVCAPDDGHRVWSVSLRPYDSSKIDEVKVSIETETDAGGWSISGSETVQVNPIRSDAIRLTLPASAGMDFGGSGFLAGSPTGAGDMTWRFVGGKLTPRLTGVLHLSNAAGACARVRLRYWNEDDVELADEHGGTVCASDNRHHAWNVDLAPYGHASLQRVTVMLQRQIDCCSWRTYLDAPALTSGSLRPRGAVGQSDVD